MSCYRNVLEGGRQRKKEGEGGPERGEGGGRRDGGEEGPEREGGGGEGGGRRERGRRRGGRDVAKERVGREGPEREGGREGGGSREREGREGWGRRERARWRGQFFRGRQAFFCNDTMVKPSNDAFSLYHWCQYKNKA